MKIDVMFGILLTILNKKHVTAKFLSSKFEISTRTVYRYVSIICSNNIPITTKSGRFGGIEIINAVSLNNVYFTASEKVALLNLTHKIDNDSIRLSVQTKLLALR